MNLPFYLTGGTALSRLYYNHRFSDDLDFFINQNSDYTALSEQVFSEIENNRDVLGYDIKYEKIRRSSNFTQIILNAHSDPSVILKIDLINDVAPHFGGFTENSPFGRVDSIRNILSNKISCVYRFEPKDIVDLWIISLNYAFSWPEIFLEVRQKEAGIEPGSVSDIIGSFPSSGLEAIRWITQPNTEKVMKDLHVMLDDIAAGGLNSLCVKP